MPIKPLIFKGDKKPKKRKRSEAKEEGEAGSSSVASKTQTIYEDDGWVTMEAHEDLNGPVMLTFSASKPVALACDATGKIFASIIESVEGEDLSTAEPGDVKQVWVINKIYGSDKYSLKSHHGKYLSCDKYGILSATREAISAEEEFLPIKTGVGSGWAFQTCRDKFMSVDEPKAGGNIAIRGDAEEIGFCQTWAVRGQARFRKKARKDEGKVKDKVTKRELEAQAGMQLDDEQLKLLKKARREGRFHEALLDIRVKHGKHDKFAY